MHKYFISSIAISLALSFMSVSNRNISVPKLPIIDTSNIKGYRSLQSFNADTLGYIKYNFVDNKGRFVNKPLQVLLSSLELPIFRYYNGNPHDYYDKTNDVPDIYINIYPDVVEWQKKRQDPAILLIAFNKTIPADSAYSLVRRTRMKWTSEAISFYGNRSVKNIQLVKFQ